LTPRPPRSAVFPYTTLFRSAQVTLVVAPLGTAQELVPHPDTGRRIKAFVPVVHHDCLCIRRWPHQKFHAEHLVSVDCARAVDFRSEEHTSELQSRENLVCRL